MPWQKVDTMSLRKQFVALAAVTPLRQLCSRFKISRPTGYKWLARYRQAGDDGLRDQSRRPHHYPRETSSRVQELVLEARRLHPVWGGRKIRAWLERQGCRRLPAPSTITEILRRHGLMLVDPPPSKPYRRFQYPQPNDLWQMDFKGVVPVAGHACSPLTMLDDHSRFSLLLQACRDKTRQTVETHLRESFERYGLPRRMLFDNGAPWAPALQGEITRLKVWLWRLGIEVLFSRVRHPQTLGKEERFHRTLKAECLGPWTFDTLAALQTRFDEWRQVYNFERPHQSLGMKTPGEIYRISLHPYPATLPPLEYGPQDIVRRVDSGRFSLGGRQYRVSSAFNNYPLGIRPTKTDGVYEVYFSTIKIKTIDSRELQPACEA